MSIHFSRQIRNDYDSDAKMIIIFSLQEAILEEKLQHLSTDLSPVFKQMAPDAYNNQVGSGLHK